mgnify:CR=1 FL=1
MGPLLLELGPCLLLGLAAGRSWPQLAGRLAPWLLCWGVPLSLMGLLLRAGLQPQTAGVAGLTVLSCSAGLLLTRTVPLLRRLLPQRSLQLGAVVGNTAYVGLPVAIALLPPQALAISITVDLVGTLVTWSLGPLLLAEVRSSKPWDSCLCCCRHRWFAPCFWLCPLLSPPGPRTLGAGCGGRPGLCSGACSAWWGCALGRCCRGRRWVMTGAPGLPWFRRHCSNCWSGRR